MRKIHVYADELGDAGPYSGHSPIYSLSLLFLDEASDRSKNLRILKSAIRKYGGDHFIHCGNLIRGEEPYEGVLREDRQALFYALVSYAGGIDFFFKVARVAKTESTSPSSLEGELLEAVVKILRDNAALLSEYDEVIVHYDAGQKTCTKVLSGAFLTTLSKVTFAKTNQWEDLFMQVADLLCVLDNLDYKLVHGSFTHSEEKFLGKRRKIKKELLGRFKAKEL